MCSDFSLNKVFTTAVVNNFKYIVGGDGERKLRRTWAHPSPRSNTMHAPLGSIHSTEQETIQQVRAFAFVSIRLFLWNVSYEGGELVCSEGLDAFRFFLEQRERRDYTCRVVEPKLYRKGHADIICSL